MLSDKQYQEMLVIATRDNARRDKADRASGFACPHDLDDRLLLVTIAPAIEAGMRIQDWQTVAEGQAMLLSAIRAKSR